MFLSYYRIVKTFPMKRRRRFVDSLLLICIYSMNTCFFYHEDPYSLLGIVVLMMCSNLWVTCLFGRLMALKVHLADQSVTQPETRIALYSVDITTAGHQIEVLDHCLE